MRSRSSISRGVRNLRFVLTLFLTSAAIALLAAPTLAAQDSKQPTASKAKSAHKADAHSKADNNLKKPAAAKANPVPNTTSHVALKQQAQSVWGLAMKHPTRLGWPKIQTRLLRKPIKTALIQLLTSRNN